MSHPGGALLFSSVACAVPLLGVVWDVVTSLMLSKRKSGEGQGFGPLGIPTRLEPLLGSSRLQWDESPRRGTLV
jgi:hypothetical protein